MEERKLKILRLSCALLCPFVCSSIAHAGDSQNTAEKGKSDKKAVYARKTELDFEGAQIEGELHNPGEFYFQHKPDDKFDSLVKRRKNFHREMMRDVVFSK